MHRFTLRAPRALDRRFERIVRASTLLLAAIVALSPVTARANDLSDSPCTAGDVEIVGSGIVVNEPCTCPPGGTFSANVQFIVRNNTSTSRYCIALHLVPDGVVLTQPLDVVLHDATGNSTAPGKTGSEKFHDTVMFGSIPNFACNTGQVCFGDAGVTKGKCSPGTCTTIGWNTSPGASGCTTADQSPPGGQCRHQQVCVVGFGATLDCTAGCTVTCGGTSTLRACVIGPPSRGPFTLTVTGDDSTRTQSSFGDPSGTTCLNFTTHPTQSPATTYTLTITDKNGCTRTDTATVVVNKTTATITPSSTPACNGVLVYTGSVSGFTGCSFTWTVDGQSLATFAAGGAADDARVARASGTGNATFSFRALDNTCHTIQVSASCGSGSTPCASTATTTAKQCVGAPASCN